MRRHPSDGLVIVIVLATALAICGLLFAVEAWGKPDDLSRAQLSERVRALEVLVEERFRSLEKALELQAGEYARRLETLNHEAARIQAITKETVPRELWRQSVKGIEEDIGKNTQFRNTAIGRNSVIIVVVSVVVSFGTALAVIWFRGRG